MLFKRLLLLCALVVLQVNAQEQRCAHGAAGSERLSLQRVPTNVYPSRGAAEGDLVGHEVQLNHTSLAPHNRRNYIYEVPTISNCALNGVSARVCDLFSPDVAVTASLRSVLVQRLGPRMRPLTLVITLHCDKVSLEEGLTA